MGKAGRWHAVLVVAAMAALGAQALWAVSTNSATEDEPDHIVSGLTAIRTGDFRMNVDHPPLMDMVCGAAAHLGGAPPLRLDSETWGLGQRLKFAREYMWREPAASQALRLIFLARLPVIAVSLALAWLVFVWARRLYGWPAAGLAVVLYCFEPNIIAHSSVATNDLGATAGYVATLYAYWRHLTSGKWGWLAVTGAALGATLLMKLSGAVLVVALPLLGAMYARGPRAVSIGKLIGGLGVVLAAAAVTMWACYGFSIGAPPGSAGPRMPVGQYLAVIRYQLAHESAGHRQFVLGQISQGGWWYYFPVAFLVKTPLPLLILLGITFARGRLERDEWYLVGAAGVYLLAGMMQSLNIGVRHILPMYALLIILAGRVVARPWPEKQRRWGNRAVAGLMVWMVVEALVYAPQYLAYFNELAGGPAGGRHVLVDSNLDWGQDLKRLAAWQREHPEARPLMLSYFGPGDPTRYGVRAEPLPGQCQVWPGWSLSWEQYAEMAGPRAGWIAISATCLALAREYRWLRVCRPVGRAGYSILIYHISEEEASRLRRGSR